MNYLRELKAFRDWSMLSNPSTGQVALWHSLMSVNNATGWVDWFTAANQTLQLMTGLSRQGLDKARNQLQQKGLIEYRKGISNQAGKYHMVTFECQKVGTEVVTAVVNKVVTPEAFEESQKGRVGSTLLNINRNINKTNEKKMKIARMLANFFPFGISETNRYDITEFMDKVNDLELLNVAYRIAEENKAPRKDSYMKTVLQSFLNNGITTVAQYEAQEAQRQAAAGGDVIGSSVHRRSRASISEPDPNSVEAFLRERGAP